MIKHSILEKIDKLPPNARKEASDFVQFLYDRYVNKGSAKSIAPKAMDAISESPFIGMWNNREDLADSSSWGKVKMKKASNNIIDV